VRVQVVSLTSGPLIIQPDSTPAGRRQLHSPQHAAHAQSLFETTSGRAVLVAQLLNIAKTKGMPYIPVGTPIAFNLSDDGLVLDTLGGPRFFFPFTLSFLTNYRLDPARLGWGDVGVP
jgi:hypothetical protein